MKIRKNYGWIPDLPDHRDFLYKATAPAELKKSIDLRNQMPPVYDQGDIGSCTANSSAAAFEYEFIKQGLLDFRPSRLFIYYNSRAVSGPDFISQDSGAMLRDVISAITTQGVCSEDEWAYIIEKFAQKPPDNCYADGAKHLALKYERIQDFEGMKVCLNNGQPFMFGITLYESFESDAVAANGMVPMPTPNEEMLGGHAVLGVGYDDNKQVLITRNSWGAGWGDKGYFYLPYDYMKNDGLVDDCWTLTQVE